MRILHIFDHSLPLHSGYAFRSRAIIDQQRRLGWETAHVTSAKQGESPLEEDVEGLHFHRTPPGRGLLSRAPLANQMAVVRSLRRRLDEVIEAERPDILHAHSPALNGLAAVSAGRAHGLPVVYECRAFWEDAAVDHGVSREGGLRYRLTRALETRVFRSAAAVTTICEGLRSEILSRGIPPSRITVIPNAVDVAAFSGERRYDAGLADRLGIRDNPVIGFIGSFYAYEGLDLLIEALPELQHRVPGLSVLLVGGGPQEQRLRRLARERGVESSVRFAGRVPHGEVRAYYDLVDIFVYPRRHMRLTDLVTPLKPLEAMARSRTLVASDVGGHRELIRDGETGFLFEAGRADRLADRLAELSGDPERCAEVARQGRAFVENERSWAASAARYEPVYRSLLDEPRGVAVAG
jgi:PEP-CTERM/exosortase A-associated glycosyltransferase